MCEDRVWRHALKPVLAYNPPIRARSHTTYPMPVVSSDKKVLLDQLLRQRILVLDGAMGTMVHALKFTEQDFRGKQYAAHGKDLKNFIDILAVTQPAAIEGIHRQYLEAGADIIESN